MAHDTQDNNNNKKKKKKKKIYNAHIVKHKAWIGGAGSRQVAGRMEYVNC